MKHRLPRKVLVVILLIALMGADFFTLNSVRRAVYWADPAHRDQAPEAWMTLGYIERSHRLPPRSLGPMLGIEHAGHQSLKQIAAARGQDLDSLLAEITAQLAALDPPPSDPR